MTVNFDNFTLKLSLNYHLSSSLIRSLRLKDHGFSVDPLTTASCSLPAPHLLLSEVAVDRRAWKAANLQQGWEGNDLGVSSYCLSKLLGYFLNSQGNGGPVSEDSDSQGGDPALKPQAGSA